MPVGDKGPTPFRGTIGQPYSDRRKTRGDGTGGKADRKRGAERSEQGFQI